MKRKRFLIIILIIVLVALIVASLAFTLVRSSSEKVQEFAQTSEKEDDEEGENDVIASENTIELNEESKDEKIVNETEQSEMIDGEKLSELVSMNDIFGKYYDKAKDIANTMTLEEKVGQLFLARYPEEDANEEIENNNPGGYILFSRDFKSETKESILAKLNKNQENSKTKMILGVDEEGGTVTRVSEHKQYRNSKFKSPQQLFNEGGINRIVEDSHEKTSLLKSLGLNMNLVPVADVTTNDSAYIYERTLGRTAEETSEYIKELIKAMKEDKMISTMKHFPGYGDNVDTHTGIAIDDREYLEFENNDFLPFKSGIQAGAPTILINHNIVNSMDSNLPASLSDNVHRILREDLKFSGIIMTDDLAMDAVKTYVKNGQAAVQAVIAGNDMIITSDFEKQKSEVLQAVEQKQIAESVINRAAIRILACKLAYNII